MVSTTRSNDSRDLRAMDLADPRIPAAWKLRNSKVPNKKFRHSSSSPTSTSSAESSSEPDSRDRRYHRMQLSDYAHPYARSGTLRSSRSMPGVSMGTTWDGRPCPVHGGSPHFHHPPPVPMHPPRRSGSMFELRASPAPSFYGTLPPPPGIYATLPIPPPVDVRSHYGSLRSIKSNKSAPGFMFGPPRPHSVIAVPVSRAQLPLPPLPPIAAPMYQLPPLPPTYLLPPGARPRPLVIPVGAEPLPVRNPSKKPLPLPGKDFNEKKKYACCRGPMPFVWFVVILVSVGVILGIILGATLG